MTSSDWQDLLAISDEIRETRREAAEDEPLACPNDGTPLVEVDTRAGRKLHCKFDGWMWPDDGRGIT
jgi:hypothetical protein